MLSPIHCVPTALGSEVLRFLGGGGLTLLSRRMLHILAWYNPPREWVAFKFFVMPYAHMCAVQAIAMFGLICPVTEITDPRITLCPLAELFWRAELP